MIEFYDIDKAEPYSIFKTKYNLAHKLGQSKIEAIAISSFNKTHDEVDSRFVNLKFIKGNEFIFFSNYNSPKSIAFSTHNQIGALIYWSSTDTQIRMKAKIKKTSISYNNSYFQKRSFNKNALAISSSQSEIISSYNEVLRKYEGAKENNDLSICPKYWGGFSFVPYYFEFWEGHKSRINKRIAFNIKNHDIWEKSILQP